MTVDPILDTYVGVVDQHTITFLWLSLTPTLVYFISNEVSKAQLGVNRKIAP
jgi:hypothetical protein